MHTQMIEAMRRAKEIVAKYRAEAPRDFDPQNGGGGKIPPPPLPSSPPTTPMAARGASRSLLSTFRKPRGFASTLIAGNTGANTDNSVNKKTLLGT
jgi:hypothetical protein